MLLALGLREEPSMKCRNGAGGGYSGFWGVFVTENSLDTESRVGVLLTSKAQPQPNEKGNSKLGEDTQRSSWRKT